MSRRYDTYPPNESKAGRIGRAVGRFISNVAIFVLILFGTYLAFTLVDTPSQHKQRVRNARLGSDYAALEGRFDTVELVLDNVIERDRNVFRILFESDPYDFADNATENRWENYERLASRSETELYRELNERMSKLEKGERDLSNVFTKLDHIIDSLGTKVNNIPAIQPVINKELTLLTAPYGMLIHPFYKSLVSHQGVDYTVPVGSRVFATADGKVKEVKTRKTTAGRYIVIDHGHGYETQYSHLSRIDVKKGQKVRRGDIIGLTGNSGLSLSPHLHYEVKFNGMRVDPIHYFFMELTPLEYQRMIKISQSGMQSFD
ncbi:MAG: M23 family metallopeptidase [Tidjanibacter sp.]|nr:M23 family metallopeptidase [Tidjanibacter sp.]